MDAVKLLDQYVDVVEGVLDLVVGVARGQLQLEDESVEFVKHDHEWDVLADALRDEPFSVECHTFDAVDHDDGPITQSKRGCDLI